MSGYIFPVLGSDWRISSDYGPRSSPGGIGSTNHRGVDIAAKTGTGVVAPIGGTVLYSGQASGYGNYVKLRGDDGLTYEFGHLNSRTVQSGQRIGGGSMIGSVGSTGNSTGPHLHFGIKDAKGNNINPGSILNAGKGLLQKGASLLGIGDVDAGDIANAVVPGSGVVLDALGITGDCGIICQLQNWIKESGFFQRLALAFLAFIILAGAFYMMKSPIVSQAATKLKGALQ